MLGLTAPDLLPVVSEGDGRVKDRLTTFGGKGNILIPLPPPGEGVELPAMS
jgi:hypothetical protein